MAPGVQIKEVCNMENPPKTLWSTLESLHIKTAFMSQWHLSAAYWWSWVKDPIPDFLMFLKKHSLSY